MKHRIANKFREIVSGSPDGKPNWIAQIEAPGDAGLFGPESVVWEVHSSVATLVGGVRALLLQAAHPAALAGVAEHSRYETDPLGRLAGTSRWLTITTFASTQSIAREAARVNAMHEKVVGEFESKSGQAKPYQAKDPQYLLWVHCAFTESFLVAHQSFAARLISHSRFAPDAETPLSPHRYADRYIAEWSKSALALGLTKAPQSSDELAGEMDRFVREELRSSEQSRRVVKFILRPPLGRAPLLFYKFLAKSAIATLSDAQREVLELKAVSRAWLPATTLLLGLLKWTLGEKSPSHEAALARIEAFGN